MRAPGSLVLAVLLAGCASSTIEQWEPIESARFEAEDGSFALELPAGWRICGQTITREGPELQAITFSAGDVLQPETPIDATAPELLEAMEDVLASQPGVKVLELGAATLAGLPGFRMHFTRELPADPAAPGSAPPPPREALVYGAIEGERLYALAYEAADGARFALDLPVFEKVVASFERRARP